MRIDAAEAAAARSVHRARCEHTHPTRKTARCSRHAGHLGQCTAVAIIMCRPVSVRWTAPPPDDT